MGFKVVPKQVGWVDTYQDVTCDKCGKTPPEQRDLTDERYLQYDNVLILEIHGGYGMFTDLDLGRVTGHRPESTIVLCHECGHEFTDWLGLDVSHWHTHVPPELGGTQHADHHNTRD